VAAALLHLYQVGIPFANLARLVNHAMSGINKDPYHPLPFGGYLLTIGGGLLVPGRSIIMAKIRCEKISEGLRPSEAVANFVDFHGRTHFIRVERDFLSEEAGKLYLPVGIVHVDSNAKAVLIELPHEAETGANRLWVKQELVDEQPVEEFA
jgi:hypothetical protein